MNTVLGQQPVRRRIPPLTQIEGERQRRDFALFCKGAWPQIESEKMMWNWHLDVFCEHFCYVLQNEIRVLIINTPFRSSKSSLFSVMAQPWAWIDNPWLRFITCSYDLALSKRDMMKSRWLMRSRWYQERWGHGFTFMEDANEKGAYYNDARGYRLSGASASSAGITGKGAHVRMIDDPHDLRNINSKTERQKVLNWYDDVFGSRWERSADDPIILIGQRSHANDLFGHVLKKTEGEDKVVHLMLPLEYDPKRTISLPTFTDPRKKRGELLDPRRYTPAAVERMKRKEMTRAAYAAQLQQDPTADGGHILQKKDWRAFPSREPPMCDMVIQCYDTAFTEEESGYKETQRRSEPSYSARTTWGVFIRENELGEDEENLILLEHWMERVSYPDLRKEARAAAQLFDPDLVLIEKKASGQSLIQDMRRMTIGRKRRIPVRGVKVVSGDDKIARAHRASLPLEQGRIWFMPFAWAEYVIDICAAFPQGNEDDTVDTVTMALNYLRRRGELGQLTDEKDDLVDELEEDQEREQRQKRRGYG